MDGWPTAVRLPSSHCFPSTPVPSTRKTPHTRRGSSGTARRIAWGKLLALDAADPMPDTAVLIAQHAYFRLHAGAAAAIVETVRAAVRSWPDVARRLGAKGQEISLMGAVIDPNR